MIERRKMKRNLQTKLQTINNFSNNISRVRKAIKTFGMIAILVVVPVITLSSCNQTSVDEMLEEYNEAFDPNFVNQ